jgi:hypothetical protein
VNRKGKNMGDPEIGQGDPKVAPSSTAAPIPTPSPFDDAIDRAIQAWLVGYIHNSEVSASGVYNHLARTLPALKECLKAELAK